MGLPVQPELTSPPPLRAARPGDKRSTIERLLSAGPAACHPCLRDLAVRRINDGDLGFLDDLYASTRAEEIAASGWPLEAQRQFLAQQFRFQHQYYQAHHAGADFLLLLRQGAPVGRLYWRAREQDATLVDISLVPPQRGRGLGTALLGLLVAHADLEGWPIDLHVEPANPARRLYERLGFAATHTHGVYLRMLRTPHTPSPGARS
jgi:GNAT superfamily N-acetyltransferase